MAALIEAEEDIGRIVYAIANAALRPWPFPHLTAPDVLDPDLARELRDLDLSAWIGRLRDLRGSDYYNENRFCVQLLPEEPQFRLPPAVERVRQLFRSAPVTRILMSRFATDIEGRLRRVGNEHRTRISLDLIEDRTGYEIEPHTDARQKLATMLLYLGDEPPGISLGTSIYAQKPDDRSERKRDRFMRVATVPYRLNTSVCFAVGHKSYHGVEQVTAPGVRRRLLQFHVLAADQADLL